MLIISLAVGVTLFERYARVYNMQYVSIKIQRLHINICYILVHNHNTSLFVKMYIQFFVFLAAFYPNSLVVSQ